MLLIPCLKCQPQASKLSLSQTWVSKDIVPWDRSLGSYQTVNTLVKIIGLILFQGETDRREGVSRTWGTRWEGQALEGHPRRQSRLQEPFPQDPPTLSFPFSVFRAPIRREQLALSLLLSLFLP